MRTAFPVAPAMVLTGNVEPELINSVHDLRAHYVVKPVDGARIERFCREIAEPVSFMRAARPNEDGRGRTLDDCIARLRQLLVLRPAPLVRYAVGAIIAEIKANPVAYGKSAVGVVATAIGEDPPTLYRHAAVAECWTEPEVRRLLERKGSDGRPLSWSHIVLLGSVASARARTLLVERALNEALSVRDLAVLAREQAGEL